MDLYQTLRNRAEADLQAIPTARSDEGRAFLGARAQVHGFFSHLVQDDSMPPELEVKVETHLTKVAGDIKGGSPLIDYHRGRIAALKAIQKLLRAAPRLGSHR